MTTRAELLELIRNGENSGVEFKRDTVDPRDLAKELVALSNFEGGRIVLGVEDSGAVVGVSRQNLEEWVMQVARSKVRPEIIPFFEVIKDVDGRDVAVVRVERGYDVHHVWHNEHRTYYVRVGSTSREASQEELRTLFQRRGLYRAELQPVTGADLSELDSRRYADYFGRVLDQPIGSALVADPAETGTAEAWRHLLTLAELLTESGTASIAGLLLFGRRPQRFLPHAAIDAAAYPGKEKDYAMIERTTIRGPLVAFGPPARIVEAGVVEQAMEFVRRTAGQEANLVGGQRVDRPAYPHQVVREAVVNAVVHRDYTLTGTTVELSVFADRLELTSPGRLPNSITVERMKIGARAARNELLKDIMRDYGYLEAIGMGVSRKIIAGMRAHNGTEPDFVEGPESLTVRLWR